MISYILYMLLYKYMIVIYMVVHILMVAIRIHKKGIFRNSRRKKECEEIWAQKRQKESEKDSSTILIE